MSLLESPPETEPRAEPAEGAGADPLISVVVACVNGLPWIGATLDALLEQRGDVDYEVVVADRTGADARATIAAYPARTVKLIEVDGPVSVPGLRALAIGRARGRLVAVLEDHCLVPRDWLERIRRAHAAGHRVIGGAVANGATARLVDRATFLLEYGAFMPPLPGGEVEAVAGNCAVYERRLLEDLQPELDAGLWEFFLHRRLRERGVPFFCDPHSVVRHDRSFRLGEALSQRYHFSRSFAGQRSAGSPPRRRLVLAAGCLLLPPLVLARLARAVWNRPAARGTLLACLPLLVLFTVPYAWGELVGSLAGEGTSTERVV